MMRLVYRSTFDFEEKSLSYDRTRFLDDPRYFGMLRV